MPDAKAMFEEFLRAFEARDAERILDAMSDDVTIETELLRTPVHGKEAIRGLLADALEAYESVGLDSRMILGCGRDAAALVEAHARFSRDLEMFGERMPTAGKEVHVVGAVFSRMDESGKISWLMGVRDTLGVVQQLGLSLDQLGRLVQKFEEAMGRRQAG